MDIGRYSVDARDDFGCACSEEDFCRDEEALDEGVTVTRVKYVAEYWVASGWTYHYPPTVILRHIPRSINHIIRVKMCACRTNPPPTIPRQGEYPNHILISSQVILKLHCTEPRELSKTNKWKHVPCFDARAIRVEWSGGEVCGFGDDGANNGAEVRADGGVGVRWGEKAIDEACWVYAEVCTNVAVLCETGAEKEGGGVHGAAGDNDLGKLI